MKRRSTGLTIALLMGILVAGGFRLEAQVAAAAQKSPISLSVGGRVSGFDPDFGPNRLGGVGGFVDLRVFHGLGIEAEGRWLRFHQYQSIHEDNYLIGPRYQMPHIWRAMPYAKVLVGYGKMNFEYNYAYGQYTMLAVGGGVDLRVTRRINLRAFDVEYQDWPKWSQPLISPTTALYPFGISAGVSYRVF